MSIRFAINGVGRIGRALLRIAEERPELELVAVNDVASPEQLARLIAHDSLHGPFPGTVHAENTRLMLGERQIQAFQSEDPDAVPWDRTGATIVVEATGWCLRREQAQLHLKEGVRTVLVSANSAEMDVTLCHGVNDDAYEPARHRLVSGASCTTNCLAPVAKVLDDSFGLRQALVNTVHSYNNDQRLLEFPHPDPRRARAATLNMIPTTTSAIQAVERVLPSLAGRIDGLAVRVPTPNVSLIDLVANLDRSVSVRELGDAFRAAAARDLRGVLAVTEEELVSSDFMRNPHSAIVDLPLLQKVGDNLYRVIAWYDNEWGHASRLADLLTLTGRNDD